MARIDEYRAWKHATFGSDYIIWHDGLDVNAVTGLQGDARARAVEMLLRGVELGDSVAAEALGAMREKSALGALRALLVRAVDEDRVRVARAIHEIAPDPQLAEHAIAVLRGNAHWGVRMQAAIALRHFSGRTDERALRDAATGDPDYLVRYHAATSLVARSGAQETDERNLAAEFGRVARPTEAGRFAETWSAIRRVLRLRR